MEPLEAHKLVLAGMHLVSSILTASEAVLAEVKEEQRPSSNSRSCWEKPRRATRHPGGETQQRLKAFKDAKDEKGYRQYIGMDEECFNQVLSYIKGDIMRSDTQLRECVPVEEKLAVVLRYLCTSYSLNKAAEISNLSMRYLCSAILEVCEAIYKRMRYTYLKFPQSHEEWLSIADEFESKWQFPHCVGALDGKHIHFTPSRERVGLFYNHKGFTSIVLLALADASGKFIFIDVGCNGRIPDGGVLSRSDLMGVIENAHNVFPPPRVIGNNRKLPYVIVADNAFPNRRNLLTPYHRNGVTKAKEKFNHRLGRARQNVERAFAMLSNKFEILQNKITLNEEKATIIVKACCVLHNFLIERSDWYAEEMAGISVSVDDPQAPSTDSCEEGLTIIRNDAKYAFMEYFNNEGEV